MLTQRLGSEAQKDPLFVTELIGMITRNGGSCDEVWLATDYGFPSLDKHRASAAILANTAERFREAGIRVSLQLSNSIGHGQYMSRRDCSGLVYEGSPVQNIVGHDGVAAKYCFCWNGEHLRHYVKEEIQAYVSAIRPHTLWLDDDLRVSHHDPAVFCCFCPVCMARFNEEYGHAFDREGLVRAINDDKRIRAQHIEFVRKSLAAFVYELGTWVHEAAPECRLGLQTYIKKGGYIGYGYEFLYDAMYRSTGIPPASRPGGGMYDDYSPADFVTKGEDLMYQMHMLPDYVTEIRPEIENLPFVAYGKSVGGTAFETSYYMAAGATDMSYSDMMTANEDMDYYEGLFRSFAAHRGYWKRLSECNKVTTQGGLVFALPKTAYLADNREDFDYTNEYFDGAQGYRFFNIPVAFRPREDSVFLLDSKNARVMSDGEIEALLARPVFADAGVARILTARGFDCGADAIPLDIRFRAEQISDAKENGPAKGRTNGGQFRRTDGFAVLPRSEGAILLGHYTHASPEGRVVEDNVSGAIVTTGKGARWAFYGFDMWTRTVPTFLRDRVLAIAEAIGGKRQCVEMVTPYQAILLPRIDAEGKLLCVSVVNVTVADSGELTLTVRDPTSRRAVLMGQYREESEIPLEKNEEGGYTVRIPGVHPWSVSTVFFK